MSQNDSEHYDGYATVILIDPNTTEDEWQDMELPFDFAQPVLVLKQVIEEHTQHDYSAKKMAIKYNNIELMNGNIVGDYVRPDAPQPVKLYVSEPAEVQSIEFNIDHQKTATEIDRDTRKMIENQLKRKDFRISGEQIAATSRESVRQQIEARTINKEEKQRIKELISIG